MDIAVALITLAVGLVGVLLGASLTRRNEKKAQRERLLVEALNDAVTAIAEVANGEAGAQHRYASAVSRIALHGSPPVVRAFREFQVNANTGTRDGQARLIASVQNARRELGLEHAPDEDLSVLLFGGDDPGSHHCPRCGSPDPRPGEQLCASCRTPAKLAG